MILLVAAGIRIIFWLLTPVIPYLVAGVIAFTILKLISWYRGRW
jgi:hypothetical protein